MVTVQFVGAGDAFGSGGRFQACISLRSADSHFLLDCGASSLIALKRLGLEPGSVDGVLVSHLHGDHFAGIPFLVLDQQFSRRLKPLTIAGPIGIRNRLIEAMEVMFPGSGRVERRFELVIREVAERTPTIIGPIEATAVPVTHPSGAPAYAYQVRYEHRVIAYSGDTEWTEALLEVATDADLFICEAYTYERTIKFHMNYTMLRGRRADLNCRRLVLTHPGPDLLEHLSDLDDEIASDGSVFEL